MGLLRIVCVFVRAWVRTQAHLAAENLALRQQLAVLHGSVKRPRLRCRDRLFWDVLSRLWQGWRASLHIFQPATVGPGRPKIDTEIRKLIKQISRENPLWVEKPGYVQTGNLGKNVLRPGRQSLRRCCSRGAAAQAEMKQETSARGFETVAR